MEVVRREGKSGVEEWCDGCCAFLSSCPFIICSLPLSLLIFSSLHGLELQLLRGDVEAGWMMPRAETPLSGMTAFDIENS